MIARLKGILDSLHGDALVLDVGGVGYLVHCAASTLSKLPAPGAPLSLYIETLLRQDAITLYGFELEAEREWFRLLISVQGVGAKVALAILGALGVEGALQAIARQDKAAFARAPGVGPKLAGRLTNELKDKAPAGHAGRHAPLQIRAVMSPTARAEADALSALVNLGYKPADAATALARARSELGADAALSELIRNGLRELSA